MNGKGAQVEQKRDMAPRLSLDFLFDCAQTLDLNGDKEFVVPPLSLPGTTPSPMAPPPSSSWSSTSSTAADSQEADASEKKYDVLGEASDVCPDGGSVAWSQVVAGHFINAMAGGFGTAFGVFQLHYTDSLGLPASQVAWIGSAQTFLNNLTCVAAGRLADAGYTRSTVLVGSVFTVLGTFMTSLCQEYWQIFLAQGVCTGIGLGLMYMPGITVVSSYFNRRRSLALGLSTAGSGTGSLVFPAVVQYLMPHIGFPWAVRCTGFIALCLVSIVQLLLRPRLPPRKSGPIVEWTAFREGSYVSFVVGAFLFWWAVYIGFFYVNTYAIDVAGFTPTSAVSLLLIMNALAIPARPLAGYLADALTGPINGFIVANLALAITLYGWISVTSAGSMYAFAVAFGLASAAAQTMYVAGLASLTTDPSKLGTRFGMCCTITGLATLSGPPIAGALVDSAAGESGRSSYTSAQVWAGSVTLGAAVVLMLARWFVAGLDWRRRV